MTEELSFHGSQIVYAFKFPKLFERDDLIKNLRKHDFEEPKEPELIKKLKLTEPIVSPEVGKKNNIVVFYDEPNKALAIKDTNFRDVFLAFKEIEIILKEDFDIDFEESINTIEGVVTLHVKTEKNAKKMIKDYLHIYNKFDDIFNEKTYLTTIRIIPENKNMSDPIWFDMSIEPLLTNPKKYFIRYGFRNSDINKFKETAGQINVYIGKVIAIIEGGV